MLYVKCILFASIFFTSTRGEGNVRSKFIYVSLIRIEHLNFQVNVKQEKEFLASFLLFIEGDATTIALTQIQTQESGAPHKWISIGSTQTLDTVDRIVQKVRSMLLLRQVRIVHFIFRPMPYKRRTSLQISLHLQKESV